MKTFRMRFAALLCLILALPAAGQTLRIGIASDPDVLDPSLSRSVAARQVFAAMCDKLLEVDERGQIIPQLATSWEWQDEGRALLLNLRAGVRFHDGEALDAASAMAGLNRHLTAPGSTRRGEMGPVTAVEVASAGGADDPRLLLRFTGSGFLFRQVRNMAGALLRVGTGRLAPQQ
jgi:peptide/nickel transport system substrate-binding protein